MTQHFSRLLRTAVFAILATGVVSSWLVPRPWIASTLTHESRAPQQLTHWTEKRTRGTSVIFVRNYSCSPVAESESAILGSIESTLRELPLRQMPLWSESRSMEGCPRAPDPIDQWSEIGIGWPAHCLARFCVPDPYGRCTTRVVWRGALLNLLFWAAIWQLAETTTMVIRRHRRKNDDQCRSCGYLLVGLDSGVCPECGESKSDT